VNPCPASGRKRRILDATPAECKCTTCRADRRQRAGKRQTRAALKVVEAIGGEREQYHAAAALRNMPGDSTSGPQAFVIRLYGTRSFDWLG